jgi:hypothetical protein
MLCASVAAVGGCQRAIGALKYVLRGWQRAMALPGHLAMHSVADASLMLL